MAYIGNNPDAIQNSIEITRFNGTGACTEFQIPQDVDDAKAIEVLVNSVLNSVWIISNICHRLFL